MPKKPEPNRSGTSRTYEQRLKKGRPNVTVSMAADTRMLLATLADALSLSMSAVIDLAIRELAKKRQAKKEKDA